MSDMLKDPKIQVDRETSKKIAEVICKEIKDSLKGNSKRYELARRCENQYNQVTIWMEKDKECDLPWRGAADFFIALSEWTVDAVWARVMSVLFPQEPYMQAEGVEASDIPKEDGVTDFVDMAFRQIIHLRENIGFYFKQMIKIPFAVLKYDWQQKFDTMMSKESAQVFVNPADGTEQYLLPDDPDVMIKSLEFMANGYQQSGTKDVWVQQDKELVNAPQLQYIAARDYVYSPHAKRNTRLFWEGDRFWMTMNEMQMEVKQDEKFIKESVDKIRENMLQGDRSQVDAIIAQKSVPYECFHWYGRLPFNQSNDVDLESKDTIEQEVHCIVAYADVELLQIMHWPNRRLPWPDRVYLRGEFEETEDFEGRSLLQKLYMTQKEVNALHNTIMNNAWISMQKIFVKKKHLANEKWEMPEIYTGAIWEEDMQGDIRTLDVGDVKFIGLEIEKSLLNFAERISNISIFQTGTARTEGGQKTLGEVEKTISEGNIGLDKFIQNCHIILRKVCQWTVDYYYDRMPPGLERRIRGDQNEMIFPTEENMPRYQQQGINPYWQQDDLAGQFDFVWKGTSLNSSKQWKLAVANDLMERYLPQPMIQGNLLATWEILKRGLEARNIKDWNTILPPKEAIIAEMKRIDMEAKAQEQKANQQSAPAMAVEKLSQKGMPQEEAVKAVQAKVKEKQNVQAL